MRRCYFRKLDLFLVLAIVALAATLCVVLHRRHRVEATAAYDEMDVAAGLDRNVPELALDGVPLDEALARLQQITGARIITSRTLATRPQIMHLGSNFRRLGLLGWNSPVSGRFFNATVESVLTCLIEQASDQFSIPPHFAARDDGSIFVGAEDELPVVLRAYDVKSPLNLLRERHPGINDPPYDHAEGQLTTLVGGHVPESDDEPPCGVLQCVGNRLVVIATKHRQIEIRKVVQQLSTIRDNWPIGQPVEFRGWNDPQDDPP